MRERELDLILSRFTEKLSRAFIFFLHCPSLSCDYHVTQQEEGNAHLCTTTFLRLLSLSFFGSCLLQEESITNSNNEGWDLWLTAEVLDFP